MDIPIPKVGERKKKKKKSNESRVSTQSKIRHGRCCILYLEDNLSFHVPLPGHTGVEGGSLATLTPGFAERSPHGCSLELKSPPLALDFPRQEFHGTMALLRGGPTPRVIRGVAQVGNLCNGSVP